MSEAESLVWVAIVAQVGTLLTLVITAVSGRRKLQAVHELVNGQSSAQAVRIERQTAVIEELRGSLAPRKPGRPRKRAASHDSVVREAVRP